MTAVTTGTEFVGFIAFWILSLPFLLIRPERFKWPFRVSSIYCGIAMFCMMVWALATAKGVSPLMTEGQTVSTGNSWLNTSWLIMSGINQSVGSVAAGILNGSDFSRYATRPRAYVIGTIVSAWVLGILIAFIGLVTTSAAQKIYGEVYCTYPTFLLTLSLSPLSPFPKETCMGC